MWNGNVSERYCNVWNYYVALDAMKCLVECYTPSQSSLVRNLVYDISVKHVLSASRC
jgi:hypothetical protein